MSAPFPRRRLPVWLLLCLAVAAVLSLTTVNFWPSFASPNERARAYQALAVVQRGSLAIHSELLEFGGVEDVATHAGTVYPNKAPGLLPLLLPGAALASFAATPRTRLELTLLLGRLLASSLPFVLTIILLARLVARRQPRGGPAVVVMWALASPALTASLLLFSHSLSALLLVTGYALLFEASPTARNGAAAGLSLAWAFACEYQLAVPVAVLACLALNRWRRHLVAVGLGAAVPATLLASYNWACFGSPLSLSSAHEASPAFAELASQGLFGISFPTAAGLAGLLASPARGLLLFAPFVVLAAVPPAGRSAGPPPPAGTALRLAPLGLLLLMAGYPNWHGGMFPGPRYLLAVVPLLTVAAAEGAERLLARRWGAALVGLLGCWGLLAVWPITATFPFPPPGEPFPSLGLARDLAGWGALFPSLFPAPLAAALWVVAAAATLGALALTLGGVGALASGALVALLLAGAAARVPAPTDWPTRLARAVIHDVFVAAPPGALEALRRECATNSQCLQVDTWIRRRQTLDASPAQAPAAGRSH